MTRVFVAGPIDFQAVSDVVSYRLELRHALEAKGLTPVDQYSRLFEAVADADFEDPATILSDATLPDEPFVRAIRHAVDATSLQTVMQDPGIVPEHTPEAVIDDLVDRDLSLLETCSGVLASLPRPSCGTMVEICHASRADVPVVVVSEQPSHYVQFFADAVEPTPADGVERIDAML